MMDAFDEAALRAIAQELRRLPGRQDSSAERVESAGRFLLCALDAGAFSPGRYAPLRVAIEQRATQKDVNGPISAWVEAVWWLRGKRDRAADPDATFEADCEMVARDIESFADSGRLIDTSSGAGSEQRSGSAQVRRQAPIEVEGEGTRRYPTHSLDFTSVNWFGTRYTFSKGNQAEAIRVLWEAWEKGEHSLSQETIREKIGSAAERFEMRKTFRIKQPDGRYAQHPAWGTMIQEDGKGCFRLGSAESV